MAHSYISLGSACNAAMMIKRAGLRRASYPFDWLLNVDDGLSVVTKIVRDDFKLVSNPSSYEVVHHAPVGKSVPRYRDYPRTFHVHSDPLANPREHAEMVRRFDRMRTTLKSDHTLHFVYYRDFTAYRHSVPGTTAEKLVALMAQETDDFLKLIDEMRTGRTTMLLVVESSIEDEAEARQAVLKASSSDSRITFAQALSRYDDVPILNQRWEREWINALARKTEMPPLMWAKCRVKQAFRHIKRTSTKQTNAAQKVTARQAQKA